MKKLEGKIAVVTGASGASPSLDKGGQPCLIDPQYPTTYSVEGCPPLSWVVAGETLHIAGGSH